MLIFQFYKLSIVALIFSFSIIFLAITMNHTVNLYDESLILVGATRVADGAIIHRDFYANYGPAQFYILAGIFKLFSPSIFAARAWDTIVRATLVVVAFLIVEHAASRRESLTAATLVLIWTSAFANYLSPVFPSVLFALLSTLFLLSVFEGHRSALIQFLCGACIGITVLFRYDIGFYTFIALTLVSTLYVITQPIALEKRAKDWFFVQSSCLFGMATICIPVLIAYVVSGTLHDFFFDIFTYPAQFYRRMRALPFPDVSDILASPKQIVIYLPIVVWTVGFFVIIYVSRHSTKTTARLWVMYLLGLLSVLFYLKGIVRVSILHMIPSIIPALLLAAMLLPETQRGLKIKSARPAVLASWMALIAVVLPTLILIGKDWTAAADSVIWAARPTTWSSAAVNTPTVFGSCRPVSGLERIACFSTDQDRADAIRYVETHSQPSDSIFVGLGHHDRIFINDMLFYFVAARRPATKWYHFDPGLQTSQEIQTEMINDMAAAKPRYVVLESDWEDNNEPNESAISSGVTLLDDFINSHYKPIQVFGIITVLQPVKNDL